MSNRNFHNIDKMSLYASDGDYPLLPAYRYDEDLTNSLFVPFDRCSKIAYNDRKYYIVHFFIEDFLFERFWTKPDKYIPLLLQFKGVISPDFSLYYNIPDVISMYNKYRNHWLGVYMLQKGIKVIPNFRCGCEKHFNFSLQGYPSNSVFACSNIGINKNPQQKNDFYKGLKLLAFARPRCVYIFSRSVNEYKLPYIYKTILLDRR